MALSKTITGQLPSHVSMDTDPLSTLNHHPNISLISTNVSADALAGPEDESRSTQEIKEEARARQTLQTRPDNLYIEKLPPKMGGGPRSGPREELQEVEYEICARVNNMSINKGTDNSYGSVSSGSSSCSSMPSADWEEELDLYKDKMPPEIRMGYIDVLILYCEDDREAAEKFQTHLRTDIELPNGPVKTLLYDGAEMQSICGSMIQHLAKGVERSTYVFIFMTKNFIEDKWCEFSSESCLMEAITNPAKQWCVVPVYTEKRNSSFRVPMGLNTLKGINYYNNDRFYRNGVSRLIGDKISVRKQANEEHKIKQKKWLEEYKRKQIQLRESQERIARVEEAKTQQLVDWLDKETKQLIRNGVLPDFMHHYPSESDIASQNTSISHSSSTSNLKSVQTQNPAVASYFQKLLSQQFVYGYNEQNYNQDQLAIIQQMYGQTSPITPGILNHVSPPVMNPYLSQGHLNHGQLMQGYFPPVATSSSYQQQNRHQVKRSTSQASADMRPSTQFQLHTETGQVSVPVPSELFEKIQNLPSEEQQTAVRFYLNQRQHANNQMQQEAQNQQNTGTTNNITNAQSSQLPTNFVPNFEAMYSSVDDHRSHQSGISDYSSVHSSRSFQSSLSNRAASNQTPASEEHLGSNMDGNRSHPEGGNLPNQSLLTSMTADGGSSYQSCVYRSANNRGEEVYKVQNRTKKETQTNSESDEESLDEKNRARKVVHIHKTVIYQPQVVQIGDHNIVHQQDSENSTDSSDVDEQVSNDSKATKANKADEEKDASSDEKHQLMKVDIKPGSETHGEMPDQPNSTGTNSSCNVDAAPSANPLSANPLSANPLSAISQEPKTSGKHIVKTKELTTTKNIKDDEGEIEDAKEVFPDDVHREYKNNFENSSKFDDSVEAASYISSEKHSRLDESVNLNSSEEKSSSLKRKQMPSEDTSNAPGLEKPVGKARPVAAVQPFSPKTADDYDDNCDNTDLKTVVKSSQTVRKMAASSSGGLDSSEQTFVKQAWSAVNIPPSVKAETDQLQSRIPAQMLVKGSDINENKSKGSANFSNFNRPDPHRLFYQRKVAPSEIPSEEPSSLDSEVNTSLRQEVALGNDPLSRETQEEAASKSFIPQTLSFTPKLNENDLEFDMLDEVECSQNTSSFEESGTKLNKGWNKRGSPPSNMSKKECVIS